MISDLLPLFGLIAAAVAVWVLRERHRRRNVVNPPAPDVAIAQAWEMWLAGIPNHPDRPFAPPEGDAPPSVPAALAEIERRALASDYPRAAVRNAILELATMALHLEAVAALGEPEREALLKGYTAGTDALLRQTLRAYRIEWFVLRWYARLRFDDAVAGDWFHNYLRVAGPYIREKVRLARDYLLEVDPAAGRFAEIYDQLLDELRRNMLAARPKKRFPPPDLT